MRWVLRQQRDAFLPLKVIKGRLEDHPGTDDDESTDGLLAPDTEADLSEGDLVEVELVPGENAAPVEVDVEAPPSDGPEEPGESLLSAREAQLFDAGPPYANQAEPGGPEDRPALHRRGPAGRATTRAIGARPSNRHGQRRDGREGRDGAVAAREERPSGGHRPASTRGGRAEPAAEARAPADPYELTVDELLEEAGVEIEMVRELEQFALITPKVVGGAPYYTRDAAAVARLASAFARHGVEARHLRAYKVAADREAGLVEQVIMPLIRQRNPEARQAAAQAVEELSHLGGELRAAFLRAALADLH